MQSILYEKPLSFHWPTQDPFLFCAHHEDDYPNGNDIMGPASSLEGRHIGQDFDLSHSWKMYHGTRVPGFPMHPHRGFETVTIVLEGFVDHFDSGGGSGRYGMGDVQWMTAGAGLQHAEMFPLLQQNAENKLHLFQVWLNLPKRSKFVEPHYKMLWSEEIPKQLIEHNDGSCSSVTVIAGEFEGVQAPNPAPDSWAATPENHVQILILRIAKGQTVVVDSPSKTVQRSFYFYKGSQLQIQTKEERALFNVDRMAAVAPEKIELTAVDADAYVLMLGAEPINEPVVMYGPFVMNSKQEIQQAYDDYERTQFGGWPWERRDPVHERTTGRIAKYGDGRTEMPK